jgi:mercuric ion transport protein
MALKKSLESNKALLIPFFSLFTSFSTLICCALPALFVSLGMGATLMGLVSTFPSLVIVSEHKILVFTLSFIMLALSALMQYRARNAPCPLDPELARACTVGRLWSKRITFFSISVWLFGAGFAFLPLLFAKLFP